MAEAMLNEMNQKHGRSVSGVATSILDRMDRYHWPGNARELRNPIERAVILCPDGGRSTCRPFACAFGKEQPLAVPSEINSVSVRVGQPSTKPNGC